MKNDLPKSADSFAETAEAIDQLTDRLREQVRQNATELEQAFTEGRNQIARSLGAGRGFCPIALRIRMNQVKPTIAWMHLIKRDPSGRWYARQVQRNGRGCARERLTKLLTQVAPEYLDFILGIEDQLQRWMPAAQDALELTRWQNKRRKQRAAAAPRAGTQESDWLLPEDMAQGGVSE
jgi:hypothetical protein